MAKEREKHYLKNKDFTQEIIISKHQDELTDKAVKMIQILAKRAIRKLHYDDPRDPEDCIMSAIYDMLKYWRNFDPNVSNNAFAFFTSIATNGYAKEFKKIQKGQSELLSLDQESDSDIYTM
jgi:hypothetical protein